MKIQRLLCCAFLLVAVSLYPCALLRADGGAVCLSQRKGDYQITVFTSPTPPRTGSVDVSVLVQDAVSGEPVPDLEIRVQMVPRNRSLDAVSSVATRDAATNKLFYVAIVDLPQAGLWDVEIIVTDRRGAISVQGELDVLEPLPRLAEWTPWIAWPLVVVVLFAVHQWLVQRRANQRLRMPKPFPHSLP